jgi:hypothetical protein
MNEQVFVARERELAQLQVFLDKTLAGDPYLPFREVPGLLTGNVEARLAHTQHQYAAMLLARGQTGDRARAMSLLDQALAIAGEPGMKSLVEKAAALKQ